MALHGNQRKFDKNSDGKLSAGEWHNWYSATYGHDIEMSERRKQAQAEDDWSSQLAQSARTTRYAAATFVAAACAILPSTQLDAKATAWRTLLCQITTALAEGNRWIVRQTVSPSGMYVSGKVGYPYRVWAYDLAELSGLCSQKELERSVRSGQALFVSEGELTAERCGSFWQQIIAQLPPYDETSKPSFVDGVVSSLHFAPDSNSAIERALENLLQSLFPLSAFFAGEMDTADQRDNRFLEYFIAHWRRLRGVYVPFCDDEVEQLVEEFPQLQDRWSEKTLADMSIPDVLCKLYYEEPAQAIAVWRSLAGTLAPLKDKQMAERFMLHMKLVWYAGEDRPELLRPLLKALQDEDFARQIFQSAFVNGVHLELINAAYACGEEALAEHFLALLSKNPLPWKRWEESSKDLKQMLAAWLKAEKARMKQPSRTQGGAVSPPDDVTVFHYCTVHVSGVRRPYVYLTGGLPLQVGDWVEVPFGKDDIPRRGQVSSLTDCTRATAPWPPEQTKTVLRVVETPVEPEKTPTQAIPLVSVAKPKLAPKPAPEAQKVSAPEPPKPPEPEAAKPSVTEPQKPPKQRFPWKTASGIFAIFVCIACISAFAYQRWNQLHQRYEQAVTLAEAGSYTEAKAEFDAMGGYRDAESLSVYCRYAELYASSTTYDGGLNELSQLTLKRNSALQADLDDLLAHVTALEEQKRLEEERAAAAKKRAEELEAYAGKLPVEGMPMRCLPLTSLGEPDKTEKCQFYDNMDVHWRYKIHHWHNSEGQTVAYCHSHWPKDEDEEVIYAFTYYDPPIGRPNSAPPLVPPFGTSDGSDPYDIEDYSTAEDFYWGNRAYFDSLDDAEAYFDNHKS